jgi:hypothetical protein
MASGDPVFSSELVRRVGTLNAVADYTATTITTTETIVDQVPVTAVIGQLYRVRYFFPWQATVAADRFIVRIRVGTGAAALTDPQLTYAKAYAAVASDVLTEICEVDWVATITNPVFHATYVRSSGTGSILPRGAATQARSLTVVKE